VVCAAAARAGIERLSPHDATLHMRSSLPPRGGELDQIQFLLGHVSIQMTERYLGSRRSCELP